MKKYFKFDRNTNTVFVIIGEKVYTYILQPDEFYNNLSKHIVRMTEDGVLEMKFCSHCGNWEPISNFNKNKRSRDGFASRCIKCTNERPQIPELIDDSDTEENTIIYDSSDTEWPSSRDMMGQPFNAKTGSMPASFGASIRTPSNGLDSVLSLLVAKNNEASALIEKQLSIINEQLAKINEQESMIKELNCKLSPAEGKAIQDLTEDELKKFLCSGKVKPSILLDSLRMSQECYSVTGVHPDTGKAYTIKFGNGRVYIVLPS